MYDPLKDGISGVTYIDHMGSDLRVVNAARVSMGKEHAEIEASDSGLINYLSTHDHWTPFSHPMITLRIKMPIFVARQWYKHQVGFTRNEESRRYVDTLPQYYLPAIDEFRDRPEGSIKQGSGETTPEHVAIHWQASMKINEDNAIAIYNNLVSSGMAPEQARMMLPQSMYTEFYETSSLAGYSRLCKLRLDPHAQLETRLYAEAVDAIIAPLFPLSWAALQK